MHYAALYWKMFCVDCCDLTISGDLFLNLPIKWHLLYFWCKPKTMPLFALSKPVLEKDQILQLRQNDGIYFPCLSLLSVLWSTTDSLFEHIQPLSHMTAWSS